MLCTTNEMTKSCKILIYKIFGNSLPQDFFHMLHTSYESIKYVITILQHTGKTFQKRFPFSTRFPLITFTPGRMCVVVLQWQCL